MNDAMLRPFILIEGSASSKNKNVSAPSSKQLYNLLFTKSRHCVTPFIPHIFDFRSLEELYLDMFVGDSADDQVTTLVNFLFVTDSGQNKLECLFVAGFSRCPIPWVGFRPYQ
jgi:hypothetical protein